MLTSKLCRLLTIRQFAVTNECFIMIGENQKSMGATCLGEMLLPAKRGVRQFEVSTKSSDGQTPDSAGRAKLACDVFGRERLQHLPRQ